MKFVIQRTTIGNSGKVYRAYLAGSLGHLEFREPGHSAQGVGIDALKTWKTIEGAEKVRAQLYPNRSDVTVVAL